MPGPQAMATGRSVIFPYRRAHRDHSHRETMYARVLKLRQVRLGTATSFACCEGSIVIAVLVALAELVWWPLALALPVAVGLTLKATDLVLSTRNSALPGRDVSGPLANHGCRDDHPRGTVYRSVAAVPGHALDQDRVVPAIEPDVAPVFAARRSRQNRPTTAVRRNHGGFNQRRAVWWFGQHTETPPQRQLGGDPA